MGETPQDTGESIHDVVQALRAEFPRLQEALRAEYPAAAKAEHDITSEYSPKYLKIASDLLKSGDFADLAKSGRETSAAEQLGAAQTELDIAKGSGTELAKVGKSLQDIVDPEYAAGKQSLMEHLQTAFKAIDPTKLTPDEEEQIARGLGRSAWNVGSPIQTATNAMQFGDALAKRRAEYNNLIALQNSTLPNLKSGLSGFNMATSRTLMPNFGLSQYTGLQQPGIAQVNQAGMSLLGSSTAAQQARMAKQKDVNTRVNESISAIGELGQGIGGFAAMCWVAREVYGESNPKWKQFREWLLSKAPEWFREWYLREGRAVASWLHDKPFAKTLVRSIMNFILWRNR